MSVRVITGDCAFSGTSYIMDVRRRDSLGRNYESRQKRRLCAHCGGEITKRRGKVRFCSPACYASARVGGSHPHKGRERQIVHCQCSRCGKSIERKPSAITSSTFCSRRCSNLYNLDRFSTRAAAAPTSLEKLLYDALSAIGIDFEKQRRVGDFVVDAYVSSRRIAIEVDGEYWHSRPENIERDRRKDAAFISYGIVLKRISEKQIRDNAISAVREALS